MSNEHKRRQLRVLIGNHDDLMNEMIEQFVEKIVSGEYDLSITSVWPGEDILSFAKEHPIDIFIIVVNNIAFLSEKSSTKRPCEDGLKLVSLLRKTYKRPLIALYAWPDDPLFPEKTKRFGATFCLRLPPDLKKFREAIEKCLDLLPE